LIVYFLGDASNLRKAVIYEKKDFHAAKLAKKFGIIKNKSYFCCMLLKNIQIL